MDVLVRYLQQIPYLHTISYILFIVCIVMFILFLGLTLGFEVKSKIMADTAIMLQKDLSSSKRNNMIDKMTLQKIRDEAYDAQVANKKYVASKQCFSKFAIIFFVLMILTGVLSFLSKSYDNIEEESVNSSSIELDGTTWKRVDSYFITSNGEVYFDDEFKDAVDRGIFFADDKPNFAYLNYSLGEGNIYYQHEGDDTVTAEEYNDSYDAYLKELSNWYNTSEFHFVNDDTILAKYMSGPVYIDLNDRSRQLSEDDYNRLLGQ